MRGSDYNDLNGEFLDFRKTGCLVDVVAHGSSIVLLYSSSSSSSCYLFIYLFFFFWGGGGVGIKWKELYYQYQPEVIGPIT